MTEEPENPEVEAGTEAAQPEEGAEAQAAEAQAEVELEQGAETDASAEAASPESDEVEADTADAAESSESAEAEIEPTEEAGIDEEQVEESSADEPVRIPNLKGLIGRKIGMTQIFDDTGAAIPVTIIEAGPCTITQIRTHAKDGYNSVQLGFVEASQKRLTGGQLGHLKRTNAPPLRHLREFRVRNLGDLQEGEQVTVQVFKVGDRVDIVGTSKGRGFAGAIKRHGFHRGPKTHGQSDRERAPGSAGAGSTPGRTFKGKKGPGHMGSVRVSSQNLRIDLVDPVRNLLGVRGSVAGPKGGLVMVKEVRKQ